MDMFSKMEPDTLAAMTRNMGAARAAAPGAAAGSMPDMPPQGMAAMQQMMNDPQVPLRTVQCTSWTQSNSVMVT